MAGRHLGGVQGLTDKAVEGVKDLGKVLKNSEKFPGLNPFVTTPEGFTIYFNAGKIPETNPLPKTSVQEHYMSEMDGLEDGKAGKIEGTGEGRKLELSDFTKEVMETKPMNSPVPKKWYDKGGTITIDENGTWTYTNKKGQSVSYPDGYPDFSKYYHPTVDLVDIKFASPTNRPADYKAANEEAGLTKDSVLPVSKPNKPPAGYIWHHHQDGKTMILVEDKVHAEFTHSGGISKVNGKDSE